MKTLWTGYVGTNAGNACATQNDGDPVVLYDQLADRWFVTQFSLPNFDNNTGPSFQCVAVSKTGDPTGAYNLYDFQYSAVINDYGKFGVWPDAYYASFNNFSATGSQGANVCAYDRAKMLAGMPATQQCVAKSALFGMLAGEPRRQHPAAERRAGVLRVAEERHVDQPLQVPRRLDDAGEHRVHRADRT